MSWEYLKGIGNIQKINKSKPINTQRAQKSLKIKIFLMWVKVEEDQAVGTELWKEVLKIIHHSRTVVAHSLNSNTWKAEANGSL